MLKCLKCSPEGINKIYSVKKGVKMFGFPAEKQLTFCITKSIISAGERKGNAMGKMGRPKSDVIKDKIVSIRMSDKEYIKLRDYSERHQQTITETIKKGVGLLYKTKE